MLRVTVVASATHAENYYSKADYYLDEAAVPARWHGKGAAELGLHGEVAFEHFSSLCRNKHPLTGKRITGAQRENRRVAFDLTFSVNKSLSVLYALAGDDRILTAFRTSVHETMEIVELDAAVRVRKGGQDTDRIVGNLVYCDFVHSLTRPVGEDSTPQPHLHAHVVVQNMALDSEEGIWKAIQPGELKGAAAPYYQAVFRAKLAQHIQLLGYDIDVTNNDFEVRGIPTRVIQKFSKRTEEIERLAEKLGITRPETKAKLGVTSRRSKNTQLTWEQLKDRWHAALTPEEIQAVHFTHEAARRQPPVFEDRSAAPFQLALDHLLERESVVTERLLLAETLRRGIGHVTFDAVQQQLSRPDLIRAVYDGQPMVTTSAVIDEERELTAIVRRGRGRKGPIGSPAAEFIKQLNAGQRAAVCHLLESCDRFTIIRGRAGVGKTTLLKAAKTAMESHHVSVTVLGPTAAASRGTLRGEGIDSAETLQRFLVDQRMQKRAAGNQVIVDEASLCGIKDMLSLARIAERHDVRVALLGDPQQHKSVSRGNVLAVLEEFGGVKPVHVQGILRQSGEYLKTVELLAEGKAELAFDRLMDQGAVRAGGHDELAATYVEHLQAGRSVLAVSPTHAEGELVTAAIRSRLKAEGLLSPEEHSFPRLVDLQTTEADRRDPGRNYQGMVAQFHRNKGPFRSGRRIIVTAENQDLLRTHASAHRLYRPETIRLAVGDKLRISAGGRSLCGHRLDTGSSYTVTRINEDGNIVLNNGWKISKEFRHLSHDWTVTSYASQSRTVDAVLVAQSRISFPASHASQLYVALSRGRGTSHALVFSDDPTGLRKAIAREDHKLTALQTVPKSSPISRFKERWHRWMRMVSHHVTPSNQREQARVLHPAR